MAQSASKAGALALIWFLRIAPLFFVTVFAMALTGPLGLLVPIAAFVAWRRRKRSDADVAARRHRMLYGYPPDEYDVNPVDPEPEAPKVADRYYQHADVYRVFEDDDTDRGGRS